VGSSTRIAFAMLSCLIVRNEIKEFVSDSQEKLNTALTHENVNAEEINNLTVRLNSDNRLHTECDKCIVEFQADIKVTAMKIEKLKLKLHHKISPPKTCGFYKKKGDDEQSSSLSHQSTPMTHFTK
jgi:hypothetical protein